MKKILIIIFIGICLIIILNEPKTFYLESKYYGFGELSNINQVTLNNFIKEKESFVLYIYGNCVCSTKFNSIIKEFAERNNIVIHTLDSELVSQTEIDDIKYFPTVVVFKKGKIVNYLKSDRDDNLIYYESSEEFSKWLTSYININRK